MSTSPKLLEIIKLYPNELRALVEYAQKLDLHDGQIKNKVPTSFTLEGNYIKGTGVTPRYLAKCIRQYTYKKSKDFTDQAFTSRKILGDLMKGEGEQKSIFLTEKEKAEAVKKLAACGSYFAKLANYITELQNRISELEETIENMEKFG